MNNTVTKMKTLFVINFKIYKMVEFSTAFFSTDLVIMWIGKKHVLKTYLFFGKELKMHDQA